MNILDYLSKGQDALLGAPNSYGGLIDEEGKKQAQQQARMMLAASLLEAGGPSSQPTNLGQALGRGMMAGQQAQQGALQSSLQSLMLKKQLEAAGRKDRGKLVAVMDPATGKPVYKYEAEAEGLSPHAKAGSQFGAYQPGDYTTKSWAEFQKSGDPSVLERYITPRQEYSPSYQNVTKTLPDGSTQQGTFDTRTGSYNWGGEVVPPGTKARVEAAGRAEGDIEGARSGKAQTAYDVFRVGVSGLEKAMEGTITGPVMGRIPAVTAGQQTAQGAEATMAPVLKQLFRDAGEGTFTDQDQELLMRMVPSRKDHPEVRKAKIEMIDGIVRAKLGMGLAPAGQLEAVGPAVGQSTTINGVKVTRKK